MKRTARNWWIDLVLFAGFILTFFMDLTGLPLHQWIGVGVGGIILVHLLVHQNWIKGIIERFHTSSSKAKLFLFLDVLLFVGFYLILYTGIIMSTWLNLNLSNYSGWYNLHVWSSIITLQILLIKVAGHWKWIVNVVRPKQKTSQAPILTAMHTVGGDQAPVRMIDRRAFLRDGLAVGAVLLLEGNQIVKLVQAATTQAAVSNTNTQSSVTQAEVAQQPTEASTLQPTTAVDTQQPVTTATSVPTSVPTSAPVQSASSSSCVVICNKGCTFPGRCHRYVDNNGNGICDNTECA